MPDAPEGRTNSVMQVEAERVESPAPATSPARRATTAGDRLGVWLERYGLVLMLLGLMAFFSLWPETAETFTSAANLRNLVAGQAVIAVAALAALIPFIAGQFDLSIGAVAMAVSVCLASLTVNYGLPVVLAVAAALVLALALGLVNGVLVAFLGAQSIVITLGVATLVGGLIILHTEHQSILGLPPGLIELGSGRGLGVPWAVWVLLAVTLGVGYFLRYTATGRRLILTGSNPDAVRLVGVRPRPLLLLAFSVAAGLYGVAGVLLLARTGAANPGDGFGITLAALTAVFLGATTIRPGHFNVPGTIIGVFFIAVSVNGLTLAGVADWVNDVFTGSSLIIAVAVSSVLRARKQT